MKVARIITTIYCLLLISPAVAVAKEWRGITPLQSTREDVIRLLGYSDEPCACLYNLGDEIASIEYSKGPCEKGMPGGWNVPRDTVISIHVTKTERSFLTDLHIDEKKYEKVEDGHVLGNVYYIDKEEGVTVGTDEGRVKWISYHPAAKDKHLRCPGDAPKEKGRSRRSRESRAAPNKSINRTRNQLAFHYQSYRRAGYLQR